MQPTRIGVASTEVARIPLAAAPTTVTIHNVPVKYTEGDLRQEVDSLGFAGKYRSLHILVGDARHSGARHAIVTLGRPEDALRLRFAMTGRHFRMSRSRKVAEVSVASVQMLDKCEHVDGRQEAWVPKKVSLRWARPPAESLVGMRKGPLTSSSPSLGICSAEGFGAEWSAAAPEPNGGVGVDELLCLKRRLLARLQGGQHNGIEQLSFEVF